MQTKTFHKIKIWAIIPVKPFHKGKSRLSKILSDTDRNYLNQRLLINSLQVIKNVASIDNIIVVSCDLSALAIAREYGVHTILENRLTEINRAINRAVIWLNERKVSKVLIIPTDLPLIKIEDVENFLQLSKKNPEIVIAPDHNQTGTNALLVNPLGIFQFNFGENSFVKHIEQAKAKLINIHIYHSKNIGHDLDSSEDLVFIRRNGFRLLMEEK